MSFLRNGGREINLEAAHPQIGHKKRENHTLTTSISGHSMFSWQVLSTQVTGSHGHVWWLPNILPGRTPREAPHYLLDSEAGNWVPSL